MERSNIYHIIIILYYGYSYYFYHENTYQRMRNSTFRPKEFEYGGDTKFLTIWCWVFQMFYFFICLIIDITESACGVGKRSPVKKLAAFRDWFLCAVAFPIALVVTLMFWSLWCIDRELVFPKALDEFFPMWLNHVLHTGPVPLLLVDLFLVGHEKPRRSLGLCGLLSVCSLYMMWILWLGFVQDIWVYPILRVLDGPKFALFISVCAILSIPIYFMGEWLMSASHDPQIKPKREAQKET